MSGVGAATAARTEKGGAMIDDPTSMDEAARFRITCSAAVLIANGVSVEQAAYEAVRLEWSVTRALVEGLPREEADDDRTC
jgi:hypothetical protein